MRDLSRLRLLAAFLGLCAVGAVTRLVLDAGALVPLLGLVAIVLTVTVARAYRPGDPPRRAWMWLACAAWLAVGGETLHAAIGPGFATALMALSNAMWCASLLDARRKILAGALVPPLARPWRWALVAAVLVGLAVAFQVASMVRHGSPVYPAITGPRLYHLGFVELCDAVVLVAGVWLLGALHPLWAAPRRARSSSSPRPPASSLSATWSRCSSACRCRCCGSAPSSSAAGRCSASPVSPSSISAAACSPAPPTSAPACARSSRRNDLSLTACSKHHVLGDMR
ncbi:hypothetical protein [Nannocystis pusilla]|uniref:hypothetical protein n=1 Tax=Nannocystis pusilla TaxID=889268 RepID=UPI003B81810B